MFLKQAKASGMLKYSILITAANVLSLCCSSSCSPSICFIWPFEHLHNLHSSDTRLLLSLDVGVEKRGGGTEP